MKEKPTTKLCKHCKTEISYNAKVCPQCRKKQGASGCLIIVIAIMAFAIIGSFAGGSKTAPSESAKDTPTEAIEAVEKRPSAEAVEEKTAPETVEENSSIPKEFKTALKKAESYSKTMSMSKIGIYNQLTSEYGEKYSAEAAQYAIDNLVTDWNANALEKAKSYSKTMHMSKAGVYDQLISEYGEQFTEEEAQYAIDNVDADWNANALEKAKLYQDTMNMSPEAIRDQLTSEYGEKFTKEEADFAIANLD